MARKTSKVQRSINYHWGRSHLLSKDGSRKSLKELRKARYHWKVHQWESKYRKIMPKKQRKNLYSKIV